MFFDSWSSIGRTALVGIAAHLALVVFLRLSGKRTLAKMNAFDLVVTVALGSTLSTILVSKQVPLADGLVGLAVLIALQFVVAWSSVRFRRVERLVKNPVSLLLYRGEFRDGDMRRQRVTEEEVRSAARSAGIPDLADVAAVLLESDGTFSVIRREALPPGRDIIGVAEPAASDRSSR